MSRAQMVTTDDGRKLPVFDSKRPMTLHVDEGVLERSKRKAPNACALAQSCMTKQGVKEVRIHLSRAYVRLNDTNWIRFLVSTRLSTEIKAFDRGGRFAPGDYVLQKITPSKKIGADNERKRISGKRSGKRARRPYHRTADVRLGPA